MAPAPALLATTLQKIYPEVEAAVRLEKSKEIVRVNNDYFKEEDFYWTDQSVFTVFTFDVLEGALTDALSKPNTIVITSRIAKKYFGSSSPSEKRWYVIMRTGW
jgi:putative ABC transport system permease protein